MDDFAFNEDGIALSEYFPDDKGIDALEAVVEDEWRDGFFQDDNGEEEALDNNEGGERAAAAVEAAGEEAEDEEDENRDALSDDENQDALAGDRVDVEDEARSNTMPPPPQETFNTLEDLKTRVRAWTLEHGYDLVIAGGRLGKKRWVRCGRAGKTKDTRKITDENRYRQGTTHKSGCAMAVWYVPHEDGSWSIQHYKDGQSFIHNHGPVGANTKTPNHRRSNRTAAIRDVIKSHIMAGVASRQSQAILKRDFPNSFQTRKDLNNMKQRYRLEQTKQMTVAEALLLHLREREFFVRHEIEPVENRIERLFAVHPDALKLYRRFSDILLVDCTYKTNLYNRPFLNIVGRTGSNKTIQVAVAILPGETEDDFTWALQQLDELIRSERIDPPKLVVSDRDRACLHAIQTVFPESHLRICSWHMNKDVRAWFLDKLGSTMDPETREAVPTEQGQQFWEAYQKLVSSQSEQDYQVDLASVETIYPEGYAYLRRTWLDLHKDQCVAFVVNARIHYGITSTSRVEGAHKRMKEWLGSSKMNILSLFDQLTNWWDGITTNVTQNVSTEEQEAVISMLGRLFGQCQRRIWRYALGEANQQAKHARSELQKAREQQARGQVVIDEVCTGMFTRGWGIPCKHTIRDLIRTGGSVTPSHFDRHWHIKPEDTAEANEFVERPLLEPSIVARRKRRGDRSKTKQAGTGVTGTARDELFAERVNRNAGISKQRKKRPASASLRTKIQSNPSLTNALDTSGFSMPPVAPSFAAQRAQQASSWAPNLSFETMPPPTMRPTMLRSADGIAGNDTAIAVLVHNEECLTDETLGPSAFVPTAASLVPSAEGTTSEPVGT